MIGCASAALLTGCGGGSSSWSRDRYALAPAAFTASQHTATLVQDGTVILAGGSRGLSTLSDAIDRFDPQTATVLRVGSLAAGRSSHLATRLATGGILITGGLLSLGDSRAVEIIDERTGASGNSGSMSVPRIAHAAATLPGGRVLVTGGYTSGERSPLGISDSAEIWEPATRRFRRLSTRMRMGRAAHTATQLADGRVLVAGGYTAGPAYQFAEIFDPADESFTAVAQDLPLRANHTAHAQSGGAILILGGETAAVGSGAIVPLASVLRFDAGIGRFSERAPLASPRTMSASVMLPEGDVLLFGGQLAVPRYTDTAENYDPGSGGKALTSLPTSRALHTVTRLNSGRILIAGGEMTGGAYATSLLLYE
jgi:hypothetical protein